MLIIPNSWISLMLLLSNSLLWLSFANTFTVTNNCPYTIWPGTLAGAGTPQLPTTGFRLDAGQSTSIPVTVGWSGRIWARTGCQFDGSGMGKCQTGDCAGRLECSGMGATPPTSLFEITLGGGDMKDFYDVSLVDGYNIPLVATPRGFSGECNATGCASDINMGCPKELQVVDSREGVSLEGTSGGGGGGGVVACKSACGAFGLAEYCCSGEFANPTTCRPSFYSTIFKRACPTAYSYAFDDGTSTFTCKASDYAIIFCPSSPGNGGSNGPTAPAPPTLVQNQAPPILVQNQAPPTLVQNQAPPTLVQNQAPPTSIQNQCNNGKVADVVSNSVKIRLPNLFQSTILIFLALNLFV